MFRHRFARILWALLLALIAAVGLSSCRSAVDAQQGPATGSGPVVRGGELRVGVLGDLSPAKFLQIGTGSLNGHVVANVYDTLITLDHSSPTPRPSLATGWVLAPDGLSLSVDLRRGVTFHDGREFTSSDVQQSLLAYLAGPWKPQFKRTAAAITGYDVTDPHRVVLSFAHPVGNIFDLLDSAPIIDAKTLDGLKAGRTFNGTGPFEFASWTPNSRVTLVRNPDYWGGSPALDKISFVEGNDPKSLYTRLRTGQLDVVDPAGLTSHDQKLATSRYGFRDIEFTGAESEVYVGVNVANPALADRRVRRAIAFAVDRDRIMTDVHQSAGYPVNLPWPKTSPAYNASANRTFTRDVSKARAILAELPPVPPIDLDYSTQGGTSRIVAEIVQSNLKDVGITADLVPNDPTVHASKLIGGEFSGLWILEHAFAQFTPSTLAVSAYPFNAAKNASNFVAADYAAAADSAWKTADPSSPEAIAAYRRLDSVWLNELFLVEIGVVIQHATASPNVRDVGWDRRVQFHFADTSLTNPDRRS
ncbi:peptide/nickel transport system substrate-binding protein [Gordonia malaquae]|nr:ABC transporter substrate-binding protein [Gordonia malaquae]SED82510.1 peptide/nickel transport system substrate-binding protein [Gordonia malaquae]